MNAKELADKFAAKVGAAAAEKERQKSISTDKAAERQEDVERCKRQMTEVVIPFLTEIRSHFAEGQFSFAPQLDLQDHKVVGVSFKIGDGPATTISTAFGNVVVTRSGDSGSSKGVNFVFDPGVEPYISSSGDLTQEKIAKLVDMAIDRI